MSADRTNLDQGDTPPVIPYAVPVPSFWRVCLAPRVLTVACLIVALGSILFNLAWAGHAWNDYSRIDDVIRSRDLPRRLIKLVERGMPRVYPSRPRLWMIWIEAGVSACMAGWLIRCSVSKRHAHLRRWAALKLLLLPLGPIVAMRYAQNLSRVRDEFEIAGDFLGLTYKSYIGLGLAAAILAAILPTILLFRARGD